MKPSETLSSHAGTTLSVVIVVRDGADVVGDALRSTDGLADELVVLDTGSEDATLEIVRAHGRASVHESTFDGFGAVKQRALELCHGDWVLSLDADERISPELASRIHAMRDDGSLEAHAGYKIRRRNWIQGRAMTSMGLQKDAPLRLFRRQGASFNTNLVHEGVALPEGATIGRIDAPIEHFTMGSIDQYLRKQDHYTTLDLEQNPRPHSSSHLVFVWPSTFWRYYVGRRGFRDGWQGLLWAGLAASGRFMRDMKCWIAHEDAKGSGRTAGHPSDGPGTERRG